MKNNLNFDVHALAKAMVADGWFGQPMCNPEKSEDFILAAADDPNIQAKLPEEAASFWKTSPVYVLRRQAAEEVWPAAEDA